VPTPLPRISTFIVLPSPPGSSRVFKAGRFQASENPQHFAHPEHLEHLEHLEHP
jgi:hypothetical protein